MRRIGLAVVLVVGLTLVSLGAEGQQAGKVYRIGWLSPGSPPAQPSPTVGAFQQTLRDLGYVEGQNLVMEYRYAEGSEERLRDMAAELVRRKVDVIVAVGAPGTRAARHATRTIPIVMTGSPDPVGEGFVASLARPGGNTTGLSDMRTELVGKQLALLKETVPQSTRIAVLANPAQPAYTLLLNNLTVAARGLGLQPHAAELRRAEELDTAFAAMTKADANALIVLAEPRLINPLRGRIVDLAAKSRLPAMYNWRRDADAGGLMSYGPSQHEQDRSLAVYVDKVLKGAKPADLPVEQPTKFELVINLKTAKALGLTIPQSVLLRADHVIE